MTMKHTPMIALLLAAVLTFSACGSNLSPVTEPVDGTNTLAVEPDPVEETVGEGRSVGSPMAGIPDYSLPEGAGTDEIRAMAVKAFHDALSVQWYTEKDFTYTLSSGAEMHVDSRETFAGIPYTNAGSGLLQWLQYYDFETGRMSNLGDDLNGRLGNSCAAGVMWGWSPVVTSIDWNVTYLMTPGHGCLPVGGYKVDPGLMNYKDYTTSQILKDNGEAAMVKAYLQVKPADALISFSNEEKAHAQMVIETPHVEYAADGSIDLDKSYIAIQDQHKGLNKQSEPFVVVENEQRLHYAGRTRWEMTFRRLLDDAYVPVTAAEFIGTKPYTVPAAEAVCEGEVKALSDLSKVTVKSPYKIITVSAVLRDGDEVVAANKKVLGRKEIEKGVVSNYNLGEALLDSGLSRKMEQGKSYTLALEVLLASGTTHTVLTLDVTR